MRYPVISIIVLSVLVGVLLMPVKANVTSVQHITITEGLSNNSVNVIFQDSRGFIWIGTEDGLNRYDGYGFEVFRFNPGQPDGLSGSSILAIAEDLSGNIWIGTRKRGISVLNRETGHFSHYRHDPDHKYSLPQEGVFGFHVTNTGDVWVKTENYLCRFDPATSNFRSYGHFSNVFKRLYSYGFPVIEESDTSLIVGTKDGVNRFDLTRNVFERLLVHSNSQSGYQDAIFDLEKFSAGRFLAATSNGLVLLEPDRGHFMRISPRHNLGGKIAVNSVCIDKRGEIWIGTNRGLDVFEPDLMVHQPALFNSGSERSVVSQSVTAIFEDASGLIWVGTRFHGVYKLSTRPPKFFSISRDNYDVWPLQSYNIKSVYTGLDGSIWLGTLTSGLYVIQPESGHVRHFIINQDAYRIRNDAVMAIHEDRDGTIWLGTNTGIFYKTKGSYIFREFNYGYDARFMTLLRNNLITSIQSSRSGLWFGTRFGLYRYSNDRIVSYFKGENGDTNELLSDEIYSLSIDKDERLWIGTSGGLNYYDELMGQIREAQLIESDRQLINQVLSIGSEASGDIWLGTRSGLLRMYRGDRDSLRIESIQGLSNEMITAVLPENNGNIWFSSSRGVSMLSANGILKDFDVTDGLPGQHFNLGSAYRSSNGRLFFGGVNGLGWVDPDSITYNQHLPKIVFTSIMTCHRGECIEVLEGEPGKLEIRFRPGMMIEVNYAAMEFTQSEKNSFRLMLEGYDQDWRPVTRNNTVTFSNLMPGKYTLRIIASNNDFVWNNEPVEIPLVIKPPLWMTNYAYAFYLLVIIFLIQMIINYRLRYYKKANRSLTEKNVEKRHIEKQREALTKINQNLTDSINYATRIQSAMIPAEKVFRKVFPFSFVYFRPKDLVSGDFYWMHQEKNLVYVATVDCTGHGVPGAFMSIIGIDLLKNIITGKGIKCPAEIIRNLSYELDLTLRKNDQSLFGSETIKDGMDMSLCVINLEEKYVDYAGAVNGLYLIRNNELQTYKGDRYAIGRFMDGKIPDYTLKRITLFEDDILYMFTDGYADQFGGADHKKFKYRRFRHLLLNIHELHPDDQKAVLHQKLEEWRNGEDQVDDILIVGFRPLKTSGSNC